jgi:hypothetical protein
MVRTQHDRAVRQRRHGIDHSPLNRWLRAKGGPGGPLNPVTFRLSVTDVDTYVSRNVGGVEHWLLCECKSNGASMEPSQQYRLQELDRALTFALEQGYDGSRYRGVHLLQLSGLEIETSQHLWLDGVPVTEADLIRFFRMEAPAEWYDRRPWRVGTQPRDAVHMVDIVRHLAIDVLQVAAVDCLRCPSLAAHLDTVIQNLQHLQDRATQLERVSTHDARITTGGPRRAHSEVR